MVPLLLSVESVPHGRSTADNLRESGGGSCFVEDKADEEKASKNKLPPACWLTSSAQLVERGGDSVLYGIPPCNEMPLRCMERGRQVRTFWARSAQRSQSRNLRMHVSASAAEKLRNRSATKLSTGCNSKTSRFSQELYTLSLSLAILPY